MTLQEIKYIVGPMTIAQMKQLSKRSGVAYPTIYRIARGLVDAPRGHVVAKLARTLA